MTLFKKPLLLLVFAAAIFAFTVKPAAADTITYDLNVSGGTLPTLDYGTLTLTLNGTGGIDVSIDLISGWLIQTGQDGSVAFNSSLSPDPTLSVTNISNSGYSLLSTSPGTVHMDGLGNFEYALTSIYGANDGALAANNLSFTVTTAGGFTSVNDLIENSVDGGVSSPFALDVFCPNPPCSGQGQTGFIGAGTTSVPDGGSTVTLLGSALVAFGVLRRRFTKK